MKKTCILLTTFIIAGCTAEKEVVKPVDIYAFTRQYDNTVKHPAPALNPLHKATVDKLVQAYRIVLDEKEARNFPLLEKYAQNNGWTMLRQSSKGNYYFHEARLNDGSGVYALFQYYRDPLHEAYIHNLTTAQCQYLMDFFKYDPYVVAEVKEFSYGNKGISSREATCQDAKSKESVAVHLSHNGQLRSKEYVVGPSFNVNLEWLLNKNYEKVILNRKANLYFTEKPLLPTNFYDGVDYAINSVTGRITIGAVNESQCKKIVYDLPEGIHYKVNGGTLCKKDLNMIEFYR